MRVLATILVSGFILFYLIPGMRQSARNRIIRRGQRSAGASYSQLNSVTGRVRPPRLSSTFWFLMLIGAVLLFALWGHKS